MSIVCVCLVGCSTNCIASLAILCCMYRYTNALNPWQRVKISGLIRDGGLWLRHSRVGPGQDPGDEGSPTDGGCLAVAEFETYLTYIDLVS